MRIATASVLLAGFVGTLGTPSLLLAQPGDSTAAPPPVVVSGFVDAYFSFNLARPTSHVNQLRNFDITENQITLSTAEISVTRAAAPIGFRIDADFGPTNDLIQSGATGSIANIGQAYITCIAPIGSGLTIEAGKFATHMGFEVIKAKDNFTYSRSLLFALPIPYYHLGIRAFYPVSDRLTLGAFVYDGFNGPPNNSVKTFGLQASLSPMTGFTLIGNWIGGPALPEDVSKKFRNVENIIAMYQATEKLLLAVDAVYGEEHLDNALALWKGVAGYVRYALADPSAVTVRAELYNDPLGFTTGGPQDLREITLTYEYKVATYLSLRTEYRYDSASGAAYDGSGGPFSRTNQSTLGVGVIAMF
jgi:hypothetical protein